MDGKSGVPEAWRGKPQINGGDFRVHGAKINLVSSWHLRTQSGLKTLGKKLRCFLRPEIKECALHRRHHIQVKHDGPKVTKMIQISLFRGTDTTYLDIWTKYKFILRSMH